MTESPDDFDCLAEMLDLLVPWENGVAAVLTAYFDASGREDGTFCVAGLAYGVDRGKAATRKWRDLWGPTLCHMTDLHARRGAFGELTPDQAGERLKQAVQIVNGTASYAVCVSCNLAEVGRLAPTSSAPGSERALDGFRQAYALCCHVAMMLMGGLVTDSGGHGGIGYVFEAGDRYQAQSQRFIADATNYAPCKDLYSYRSHMVATKADARLLETADILAWEWAKHVERVGDGHPMRKSLATLLKVDPSDRLYFKHTDRHLMHLTGPALERFFFKIGGLLNATTEDELKYWAGLKVPQPPA